MIPDRPSPDCAREGFDALVEVLEVLALEVLALEVLVEGSFHLFNTKLLSS